MHTIRDVITGVAVIGAQNCTFFVRYTNAGCVCLEHQLTVSDPILKIEVLRVMPVIACDVQEYLIDRPDGRDDVFLGSTCEIRRIDNRLILRGLTFPIEGDPGRAEKHQDQRQAECGEFPISGPERHWPV